MLLTADGVEYSVHFVHKQEQVEPYEPELRWITTCAFHEGKCQKKDCPADIPVLGVGTARVHQPDDFSKYEGRKRSLARALRHSGFSRDKRRQLWTGYFQICPLPVAPRIATLREVYNRWHAHDDVAFENWLVKELQAK